MVAPAVRPLNPARPAVLFVLLGGACVIGGGLLSAAMAPSASYHSSWAVAYIVLIAGVAQAVLGLGQAALAARPPARATLTAEILTWNVGNAAVVAGALVDVAPVLYLGCASLIVTLVLVLRALRGAAAGRLLVAMRVVIVVLLVSMPVGIAS